ncbi:iron-sulfur cluster carrier protein ApbC [bacterium]|nr:iron-sulfur cluster carrier protein ApbC [bacterium]
MSLAVYYAVKELRGAVVSNLPKYVVAIASGKGGVGKSTVAVNIAAALVKLGHKVGLLDADIYGPSQRQMLGVAESVTPEQQDGKYLLPIMAHGIAAMSMGFLTSERTPTVWRGPMASGALVQMLEQTLWGDLDILLIDMPPGTGDIQLTLSQKVTLSGAVIVTTPQDIALLDARKGIEMFNKVSVPILGLVENMAVHICAQCGHKEHIFGEQGGQQLAGEYHIPVLASLPLSLRTRENSDAGQPLVLSAADSSEAALFLDAAAQLWAVVSGSVESTAPTITMGDD